jgi:hypothetical protein
MSYGDLPPARPEPTVPPLGPPPPPPPRNGCLTAIMVLVGLVLLLPGLCAVIFGVGSLTHGRPDPGLAPFIAIGLLVGFGGIMLLWWAGRGRRP